MLTKMEVQELIIQQHQETLKALSDMAERIQSLETRLLKQNVDVCEPNEALAILGLNNPRYLKYYHQQGLLDRRKGLKGFVYYKGECHVLAQQIKDKKVIVPSVSKIYE